MAIKKAYQDIVTLLETNKDAKVSDVLEQVIALASSKGGGGASAFIKDANGNTVAIFDYYFKRWMPLIGPKAVEFGKKANTATGFNSMCKEGVSHWTKAQRVAKQENANLLTRVASGEIKPTDIASEQAKIEQARQLIIETELGFHSDDKEKLARYLAKHEGAVLAEAA